MSSGEQAAGTTPVWSIGSVKNGRGYRDEVMVYDRNGVLIANCEAPKIDARRFARTEAEDRANARLIAAAPALLAALMGLSDGGTPPCWCGRLPHIPECLAAEAAIATATQAAPDRADEGVGP